mgnify:CR=1 FL=1
MTEREKMINGALYDPSDPELEQLRLNARKLARKYNRTDEDQPEEQAEILRKLLPATKQLPYLQAPVYFDYGCNTYFGKYSFANFNFTCLDVCEVHIGDNVMIGQMSHWQLPCIRFCRKNGISKSEKMEAFIIWNMPNPSP